MSLPRDSEPLPFKPIRLQRFLAQCGLGSRRDCEDFITAGRVEVDGRVVNELGSTVDPGRQTVSLDGERLKVERKKYFLLNKPSGYLCTSEDPQGRRVVFDLFPQEGPRLFTVGRLDENTTGLLVVTNDGDLAQRLAHPRYRIFRVYRAQIAGQPKREIFDQLKEGLFFTEGKFRVYNVRPIKKQKDSTWVEITMTEGQNREIRRLFARVGHKVMKLERIGYGPLRLGRLAAGEFRDLTRDELAALHSVLERNQKAPPLSAPPQGTLSPTRTGKPDARSEHHAVRKNPSSTGSQRPVKGRNSKRAEGEHSRGPGGSTKTTGKWSARTAAPRNTTHSPSAERNARPGRPGKSRSRPPGRRPPKGKGR